MSRELRSEQLDLRRLAAQGAELSGTVPIAALSRLVESLVGSDGEAEYELRFGLDQARRPTIEGWASAAVELCCQRCLGNYVENLSADLRLVLVQTEAESERLAPEFDPLLDTGGPIRIVDLIEDELILALPIIPMHESEDCGGSGAEAEPEGRAEAQTERENPFAVLAKLKRNDD